ncbi:hypothetical protein [Dactylosporangium sp. NPDC000521]|uniref:hypothetical protein n=1 Tax=Dactylosporangium sp. NPDC000521 TaxID=3363975 RepID=UPI0036C7E322
MSLTESTYLLVVGLVVVVIGLALATSFKGIVDKHVDLSMRWVAPVSPLRRRTPADRLARRRADMVWVERALGVALALFGLAAAINGLLQ